MAGVNALISLGIGSPADVPHFVLFGLSPSATATKLVDVATYIRRVDERTAYIRRVDDFAGAIGRNDDPTI